jgi:hypothetical protein
MSLSVQPYWCRRLPVQQQSVMLLASRGPDGVGKYHPCKAVVRAYRGTVLVAAKYGRPLDWGEKADTFMSLERFANDAVWRQDVDAFLDAHDELPKHYLAHLMHGAQIVGFKHPDDRFRSRWSGFYHQLVDVFHLNPETEEEMDERLGDWNRDHWSGRTREPIVAQIQDAFTMFKEAHPHADGEDFVKFVRDFLFHERTP